MQLLVDNESGGVAGRRKLSLDELVRANVDHPRARVGRRHRPRLPADSFRVSVVEDEPKQKTLSRLDAIILTTPALEDDARLSSDGRWMAYHSNESGRFEVYVAPYPGPGGRSQVSTSGGSNPVWSPEGRELFFQSGNKLMAAAIATTPELRAGVPRVLFEGPFEGFDVAPDGQRFLLVRPAYPDLATPPLVVVLGWLNDLERRAPAKK